MIVQRKDKRKGKNKYEDILLNTKKDRRLLAYVPDKTKQRNNKDRRGASEVDFEENINEFIKNQKSGVRYKANYDVSIVAIVNGKKVKVLSESIDISMTGILLRFKSKEDFNKIKDADNILLKFKIKQGKLPEGFEGRVKINGDIARIEELDSGEILCGMAFQENLSEYVYRVKGKYIIGVSSLLLFLITAFIVLMRAESVIYFKFNKSLYLYSIVAAIFLLSRYFIGMFYRPIPIDINFTPGVTILIPCFNEEEWIQQTIISCMDQDYPIEKLEVIIIDDFSTDKSVEKIKEIVERLYKESAQFDVKNRLKYILMEENGGKREALSLGVLEAKHDLVVFVDSDSFLDPYAIRNLVQPFKDPKMGGVSGRTDVANTYTNVFTKMQSVRYYIAFRIMKAAESFFDAVSCLSGPLACYKKSIILENMDAWLNQSFLGHSATFGDDRAMTNFVLKEHRTSYQDTAICHTIVPNRQSVFLKQQMRWKRSWLRESIIASKFMWKKEPFAAATFYMGVIIPILAPIIVVYNLIYVPITYKVFPKTFLIGIFLMSLLMSIAQLLLRKSSTWIFGLVFTFYYEAVLLWQMPIAWLTFWKSTWGTRMTPSDVKAQERAGKKRKIFNKTVLRREGYK